jgi:DNA-binding NarL/FixJ family response regulator
VAIKLIIADDHVVIRMGLARLLEGQGVDIVAETSSGKETLAKTRKLKPDVLLMDVIMPDMDGLDTLERVRKAVPQTKVIMMSALDNPTYTARAMASGAATFLLKDASGKEFVSTIKRVAKGEALGGDTRASNMKTVLDTRPDPKADDVPLTKREYQVVRHLALGLSNREIASSLGISIETVKEHVQNVLRKLDCQSRTAVAMWAVKKGLV